MVRLSSLLQIAALRPRSLAAALLALATIPARAEQADSAWLARAWQTEEGMPDMEGVAQTVTTITTAGSSSWTAPSGGYRVQVEAWGGDRSATTDPTGSGGSTGVVGSARGGD